METFCYCDLFIPLSFCFALFCFFVHQLFWTQARPEGIGIYDTPMRGTIPTQSHNRYRLATPPGSMTPYTFQTMVWVLQEQISESDMSF